MHMFTSLRRYCVESISSETYDDSIHTIRRLIRVIRDLLTLPPSSDVEIHLPIDPREFGWLFRTNESMCHELCTSLRKLMYRFGLGFRVIDCDIGEERTFYTFAPRRWPARPNDITDHRVVGHYVLRLCGIGVCSRCHDEYWHPDCKNCLSCNVFQTPADSQSKCESERRVRARLTK